MSATPLNTTDYAVLGLLRRQSWSAYELTQFMRDSYIRAIWPRAESRLYESPKKLASLGYATVSKKLQGKRQKAIYSITDNGAVALSLWLKEGGKSFSFEYESMLKLAFADIEQSDRQLELFDVVDKQSSADAEQMVGYFTSFADEDMPGIALERLGQNVLVNAFIKEIIDARLRWSSVARKFQQQWQCCKTPEQQCELIRRWYREAAEQTEALLP